MAKVFRQGEVAIIYKSLPEATLATLPDKGKQELVSKGSSTDHTHVISAARLTKMNELSMVGKVGRGSKITTGESRRHSDISLPAGEVEVRLQVEWDGGTQAQLAAD